MSEIKKIDNTNLTIWFIAFVACLLMLISVFANDIRHRNRIDDIFEQYEKDMEELHNE